MNQQALQNNRSEWKRIFSRGIYFLIPDSFYIGILKTVILFFVAITMQASEELLTNGSFRQLDSNNTPVGWEKSFQGAPGIIEVDRDGAVKIVCHKKERVCQTRLVQRLNIPSGQVYELTYEYRSGPDSRLKADVLLTRTGPTYRCIWQSPGRKDWTKRRIVFYRPSSAKGTVSFHIQNRSNVPVWYRNISLKKSKISRDEIARNRPRFQVNTLTPDAQTVIGDNGNVELAYVITPKRFYENYDVEGQLFNAEGKLVQTVKSLTGGCLRFASKNLTTGKNLVNTVFFDKSDGTQVGRTGLWVEKVSSEELKSKGDIDWNKHGTLITRDGKPFFPIIMYGLDINKPEIMKNLKEQGFNTIHSYSFEGRPNYNRSTSPIWRPAWGEFLKYAEANNMKVLVGFPRWMAFNGHEDLLTQWIRIARQYPAVLCYYSDEMYCQSFCPESAFAKVRKVLDREDPKRQWLVYDSLEKNLGKYWDGCIWEGSAEGLIKLAKLRIGATKPYIHVFGQIYYPPEGPIATQKYINYELVMPLINGARGFAFWYYPILCRGKNVNPLRKYLYSGTRVLAQCADALASPQELPTWAQKLSTENGIKLLTVSDTKSVWLFLGNSKSGKAATFTLPKDRKFTVKLGVAPEQGKLHFAPGDVAILESQR